MKKKKKKSRDDRKTEEYRERFILDIELSKNKLMTLMKF
jgi:hypothetical protein